jgi:signal transduction histidine kinase
VLAALAAGATYYLHTFAIALAVALGRRSSPLAVWRESFCWLWPHYPILGAMALLLALAHDAFGLVGVATFVLPPILMRQVAKQYLDNTVAHVRELREVNARLEAEIAQRTAAEQESARLAREAARAAALEELSRLKSEFVSIASHELRTPTTAVLGFSELLMADIPPEDPSHRMVSLVHRNAEQLASLVDNLLDVSRIEVGEMTVNPTSVELTALLPAVLAALEAPSPRHRLTLEVAPEASTAWVDADRLRQIVTNLVSNAMKYADGGEIRISTRPSGPGWIALTVADQGVGIAREHLERIFDRFQRVDRSTTRGVRGTGLGLYIVRHLVELHGGTIRVESEPGRGSVFEVTLPAQPSARASG